MITLLCLICQAKLFLPHLHIPPICGLIRKIKNMILTLIDATLLKLIQHISNFFQKRLAVSNFLLANILLISSFIITGSVFCINFEELTIRTLAFYFMVLIYMTRSAWLIIAKAKKLTLENADGINPLAKKIAFWRAMNFVLTIILSTSYFDLEQINLFTIAFTLFMATYTLGLYFGSCTPQIDTKV